MVVHPEGIERSDNEKVDHLMEREGEERRGREGGRRGGEGREGGRER